MASNEGATPTPRLARGLEPLEAVYEEHIQNLIMELRRILTTK